MEEPPLDEPTPGAKAQAKHREGVKAELRQINEKLSALLVAWQASGVGLPDRVVAQLKDAFSPEDRR